MEQLGVEPIQLLTQIFNFLVMAFLLTKILYKPIVKSLEERRKKIAEGLAYSEKMKDEAEKNEKKRVEVVNKAKVEAREIIEEAKKSAKSVEADIIKKAHIEAENILEKSRKELDLEKSEIERQLSGKTVEIASNMVRKVFEQVLSEKEQKLILDKKIKDISKFLS